MDKFYIDTCIWLNLFKKEGDATKGIPYWKMAEDFIEKVEKLGGLIIISPPILKEIYFNSPDKYSLIKEFFNKKECIKIVKPSEEDYFFARKTESKLDYEVSFLDCIHISISKRIKAILITRDKLLIKYARKYIKVSKPEDLFN